MSQIKNGKSVIQCLNQKLTHIKRKDNNYYIPDLVRHFIRRKWWIKPGFTAS